jgi:hypothetical protein
MDEIISYKMCAVKVRNAKLRNYLKATHVKISHLVTNVCQQAVNKLSSQCLSQVVNKFGTSC